MHPLLLVRFPYTNEHIEAISTRTLIYWQPLMSDSRFSYTAMESKLNYIKTNIMCPAVVQCPRVGSDTNGMEHD